MDCTFSKKATKKHTNIEKNFIDKPSSLVSPYSKIQDLPSALVTPVMSTAIRELSMMAVEAKRVDAIILFLSVCTARTPFLAESSIIA